MGFLTKLVSLPHMFERVLLSVAAAFLFLNWSALMLVKQAPWHSAWPFLIWSLAAFALHWTACHLLPKHDPFILPVVLLLSGWGVILVNRLAPAFALRQIIWVAISALACLLLMMLPPDLRMLRRFRYTLLLSGIILLGATIVFGVNPSGFPFAPRLWLGFGAIFFQPSEILKLLLVIFLSSYLAEKHTLIVGEYLTLGKLRIVSLAYVGPLLLMWGFCMVLLIWQRDLGTASLFFIVFLAMLYVATGRSELILGGLVLLGIAAVSGYVLFDVVRLRVDTWWNPWPEADNRAFQIIQSLMAFAAGGLFGQGIGQGSPTFIPVVHSDFVFAAIAEEWGMVGTFGVLLCIALLVSRALHIASSHQASRPFHALLASGIGLTVGIQSLMIMSGVLRIVPLTGITLPFVSYGGSSLLSGFIMIGLLLRLSDTESHLPFFGLHPLLTRIDRA